MKMAGVNIWYKIWGNISDASQSFAKKLVSKSRTIEHDTIHLQLHI